MDRIKKIINYITWAMIAVTGILFLILLFIIEIIINTAFTLGYDIPFIRGMKKTRQSSYLTEIISMAVRVLAVLIISAFILQGVWRQ